MWQNFRSHIKSWHPRAKKLIFEISHLGDLAYSQKLEADIGMKMLLNAVANRVKLLSPLDIFLRYFMPCLDVLACIQLDI